MVFIKGEKESDEEIERAFQLFDRDGKDEITFENLKEIAKELGETMSDDELKLMLHEANKDALAFLLFNYYFYIISRKSLLVKKDQFKDVLSRATNFE